MCVVAIAWEAHPRWSLVAAGNRDEFHARASAPLAHWAERNDIIAGRDLVSGGTWMGVSTGGRFAVVTNIRDADGPNPQKMSRGALVTDWLGAGKLPDAVDNFNPFNLILSDKKSAQFVSNRPQPTHQHISPGIEGLSNAIPDEHWPRKDRLVMQLTDWMAGSADEPRELLDLLGDESTPDRDAYPVFIRSPVYGTRCSTVVAVDIDGQGTIFERRFDRHGTMSGETSLDFVWTV